MTDSERERFRQSLERCRNDPGFMKRFYHLFMESSPEIAKKFQHTNWDRQYQMVVDSFLHLTDPDLTWNDDDPHLGHLAEVHGAQGQAVPAWMFDNWTDALLQAVMDTDPQYDDEIDAAWRKYLWKGIAFMKARYNQPRV